MEERVVFGVEIDICPSCRGVFLDPGEAEAQGVDTAALFGGARGAAIPVGVSTRLCPVHAQPMHTFRIVGSDGGTVDVDRTECCGGIFLDPGEQGDFAAAAERAAWLANGAVRSSSFASSAPGPRPAPRPRAAGPSEPTPETLRTASGAVFAAPPPEGGIAAQASPGAAFATVARGLFARGTGGAATRESGAAPSPIEANQSSPRCCPRCSGPYRADRTGGVEVDVCDACGSMFFDPGETDAKGIDTAALFGVGAEGVELGGASALGCPACGEPMQVVRVSTLAGILEVDRAPCCGGLFLDGGELDPFARAAQVASWAAADRTFEEKGEVVGERAMQHAMASGPELSAATASFVRGRVDAMVMRMVKNRYRRWGRRGGFHFD